MIDNFETFHSKPYNISPGLEHQLDELIEEYLEKGYLIPIQNPKITSSVFLVPKNSNEKLSAELDQGQGQQMKYRMVVDYRRLNQQVAPTNSYNVRGIFSNLHKLQGKQGKYYACLDLKQYFYQIPTSAKTKELIAINHASFATHTHGVSHH